MYKAIFSSLLTSLRFSHRNLHKQIVIGYLLPKLDTVRTCSDCHIMFSIGQHLIELTVFMQQLRHRQMFARECKAEKNLPIFDHAENQCDEFCILSYQISVFDSDFSQRLVALIVVSKRSPKGPILHICLLLQSADTQCGPYLNKIIAFVYRNPSEAIQILS